jgi:LysM repeat protein
VPPAGDSRRRAAHVAAPFLFLAAVTVAVLLIRAGLESGSSGPKATTTVPTQTAPGRTTSTKHGSKPGAQQFYTVQTGDTFSSISVKTGVSIADLERLNPGVSSNALHVGQKLRVK